MAAKKTKEITAMTTTLSRTISALTHRTRTTQPVAPEATDPDVARLILGGHLRIIGARRRRRNRDRAQPGRIYAQVHDGDHHHNLGWTPARGGWWCDCSTPDCSHLSALRLVAPPDDHLDLDL